MSLTKGCVVISKAGRDKGKLFFVLSQPEENIVMIVDGKQRNLEHPKKKKLKHVMKFDGKDEEVLFVSSKIASEEKVTNSEIRKALNYLNNKYLISKE
ncbi:MAG: RNA-binding protein [Clostridia bacterium]|nr:RNA-binding protein [Clostridia bacterium]